MELPITLSQFFVKREWGGEERTWLVNRFYARPEFSITLRVREKAGCRCNFKPRGAIRGCNPSGEQTRRSRSVIRLGGQISVAASATSPRWTNCSRRERLSGIPILDAFVERLDQRRARASKLEM